MIGDLSLQTFLLRLSALLLILALQGAVASFVATRLGDNTPRYDGRLTLNPLEHVEWTGAVAFIVAGLGWMRPIWLDYRNLRGGLWGVVGVIFAVEIALLALAMGAIRLLPLASNSASFSSAPIMAGGIVALVRGAVGFALFNLVPLPPLMGGHLLLAVPKLQKVLNRLMLPLGLAMLTLVVTGLPARWLASAIDTVLGLLSGDTPILLRKF